MAGPVRGEDDDLSESHDINVTPMIDVMLVLLIIFMVAAPLATVDVPVNLPTSNATPTPRPLTSIVLTLRSNLDLVVAGNGVERSGLAAALDAKSGGDRTQQVYLRADGTVPYVEIMNTMNLLRNAGYTKVSLVALEPAGP